MKIKYLLLVIPFMSLMGCCTTLPVTSGMPAYTIEPWDEGVGIDIFGYVIKDANGNIIDTWYCVNSKDGKILLFFKKKSDERQNRCTKIINEDEGKPKPTSDAGDK